MKAVVLRRPRTLELMDLAPPSLGNPEQVLIEVKACGICGSDLRYWAGENPWALHTLGRNVENPPNIIMGHEYAGVVAKVASARYEHLLGARVGVQAYRVCGRCRFCLSGRHNLCKQTIHMGHAQGWGEMDFYPGAYAEYCPGWGDLLYPLPDHVSFESAAMADVFCVAVHVVRRGPAPPGAAVLCIGGGPIGLSIAQVARAKGAGAVVVVETSPLARLVVEQHGFITADAGKEAAGDAVAAATGSRSVAAVYDTVGNGETMTEYLDLLEESGTYVNVAVHSTPIRLDAMALGSERTLTTSSNAFYEDVAEAYNLIFQGKVNASGMITHRLPLASFDEAFQLLLQVPKGAYKVVFTPTGA